MKKLSYRHITPPSDPTKDQGTTNQLIAIYYRLSCEAQLGNLASALKTAYLYDTIIVHDDSRFYRNSGEPEDRPTTTDTDQKQT